MTDSFTGGCQCGAVRYRFSERPRASLVCHCRMCQKAFSAPFPAFVGAPRHAVIWTRGAISVFHSSSLVERGFCCSCGTPLTFARREADWLNVATFSLDDPRAFPPAKQFAANQCVAWIVDIRHLPSRAIEDGVRPPVASFQHPDHDTAEWQVKE